MSLERIELQGFEPLPRTGIPLFTSYIDEGRTKKPVSFTSINGSRGIRTPKDDSQPNGMAGKNARYESEYESRGNRTPAAHLHHSPFVPMHTWRALSGRPVPFTVWNLNTRAKNEITTEMNILRPSGHPCRRLRVRASVDQLTLSWQMLDGLMQRLCLAYVGRKNVVNQMHHFRIDISLGDPPFLVFIVAPTPSEIKLRAPVHSFLCTIS
ncbi:hypothetical protein DFH06DRAFT_1300853 [Mycena polygramma]|nr:hypothetical protein DFH06DRAFT_1300853 [Mycena polygramma]